MARGLDHVVHAVADLDAATAAYERCGFQVGPRNRHPWGTHNRLVQFPGFFIEILTIGEPAKLGDDGLSQHFGRFQQDAIARGDGLSMLLVASNDADTDAEEFARAGIGCSPVLPFSRDAVMADGNTTTVGFALTFARDSKSPHTGFAACNHLNPKAFWNAEFQRHRNGAVRMAGVVLTAERPADHAEFFRALTACEDIETSTDTIDFRMPRGAIEILTVEAFAQRTGVVLPPSAGAQLRAMRFAVPQLSLVENILRGDDIPSQRVGAMIVMPPQAAFGATLLFEEDRAQ